MNYCRTKIKLISIFLEEGELLQSGLPVKTSLREAAKKVILELSGNICLGNFFLELQKKFFFFLVFRPSPPPLSDRATKERTLLRLP